MIPLLRILAWSVAGLAFATLVGCSPDYSPNTYSGNAVQQANKVERAVVIGFRQVKISANGTIGAVTGGAAGGVLGSQADASGITSALGAVGGTLVGGIVGRRSSTRRATQRVGNISCANPTATCCR